MGEKMKIGKGTKTRLLFIERDLIEGQKFAATFGGTMKRADSAGKNREYAVIIGGVNGVVAEWLVFPNCLRTRDGKEIEIEGNTHVYNFIREGRDLVIDF